MNKRFSTIFKELRIEKGFSQREGGGTSVKVSIPAEE